MAAGKNTHLAHIDDCIIIDGSKGGHDVVELLKLMSKFLSGNPGPGVKVTTKFDGAPAVICGIDPEDGKFFVGTKSVFAKDRKLCKSEEDVRSLYTGQLMEKLVASFNHLKQCGIKGVLQGDLMFTNDKKEERIDGDNFVTFRPNTITYAAPTNSKLGREIKAAQLGIVFHTKYTGDSLDTMTASFNVSESDYRATPNVWIQRAEFNDISGVASMSPIERTEYEAAIRRTEGSLKQASSTLDLMQTGKKTLEIDTEFLKFFNNYVKAGSRIPSVDRAYNDFMIHLGKEYDKKIQPLKTLAAQEKKAHKFVKTIEFLEKHERGFKMVIASYMNIQYCKHILVDKMKKVSQLRLFVMVGGDYQVTSDEGYVAITSKGAVKLIDRLEFSRLNFSVEKLWDK